MNYQDLENLIKSIPKSVPVQYKIKLPPRTKPRRIEGVVVNQGAPAIPNQSSNPLDKINFNAMKSEDRTLVSFMIEYFGIDNVYEILGSENTTDKIVQLVEGMKVLKRR